MSTRGKKTPNAFTSARVQQNNKVHKHARLFLELTLHPKDRELISHVEVFSLVNREAFQNYKAAANGLAQMDLWYNPLPGSDDTMEDVVACGFRSPHNDENGVTKRRLRFGVYFLEKLAGLGVTFKMLMCKVAVGKSLARAAKDVKDILNGPAGYNSLYVPAESEGDKGEALFNDTYYLFDRRAALPMYIVEFRFSEKSSLPKKMPTQEQPPLCSVCGRRWASVQCLQCTHQVMCATCDMDAHSGAVTSHHQRGGIEAFAQQLEECRLHNHPCDKFCWHCRQLLCIQCRNSGEHNGHIRDVLSLDDAYPRMRTHLLSMEDDKLVFENALDQVEHDLVNVEQTTRREIDELKKLLNEKLRQYVTYLEDAEEKKFEYSRALSDIDRAIELVQHKNNHASKAVFLDSSLFFEGICREIKTRTLTSAAGPTSSPGREGEPPIEHDEEMLEGYDSDQEISAIRGQLKAKDAAITDLMSRLDTSGPVSQ